MFSSDAIQHIVPVSTPISGQSVADGTYQFKLLGMQPCCRLEYLTFTPAATAGTVTVQVSPDGGVTWDDMAEGVVITASAASASSRTKPSGKGKATHLRLTFAGITGATSFVGEFTQGVV